MPTPNAKTAPPAEAAAAQSTTPESLGWQLRAALPPMRLHSVTLCDHQGDVLWLSEGALGPDEHGFVGEAMGALTGDASLAHCESDLQDGRYGVFLAVRAPQGDLVGLVMILADSKGLSNGTGARILTQQVRSILQKIAIHLRPQSAVATVATPPVTVPASNPAPVIENVPVAPAAANTKAPAAPGRANKAASTAATGGAPSTPAARAGGAQAGNASAARAPLESPGALAQMGGAAMNARAPAAMTAPVNSFTGAPLGVPIPTASPAIPAKTAPAPAARTQSPPADFGSTTSILSPLAVDDILSFELVDDDSPIPAAPVDPALAMAPSATPVDDGVELALEEEPVIISPKGPAPIGGMQNLKPPAIIAAAGTPSAFVQKALSELASTQTVRALSIPPAATPPVDVPVVNAAPAKDAPHDESGIFESGATDGNDSIDAILREDAIPTVHHESSPALPPASSIPTAAPAQPFAAGLSAPAPSAPAASSQAAAAGAPASPAGYTPGARQFAGSSILAAMSASQAISNGAAPPPVARGAAPSSTSSTGLRRAVAVEAPPLRPSPLTDPAFKDLALSVQLLNKLRPGGRTRRYEVLVRNKQNPTALDAAREILRSMDENADLDGFVLCQLLTWLAEHPQASEREPLTFSINLSARALHDERFPDFIAFWLRKTGVAPESIGFELAETVCVQHKPQAERFVAAVEKLGCFIVLDDFTMDSRALDFLRSKSLKLIKLESRLTNDAMKDKVSQALVIAISQAAKVLGVHCAAKKIESQMVRRWITAIGFDFAQGTLFEGPQHVDGLLAPPIPKPEQ